MNSHSILKHTCALLYVWGREYDIPSCYRFSDQVDPLVSSYHHQLCQFITLPQSYSRPCISVDTRGPFQGKFSLTGDCLFLTNIPCIPSPKDIIKLLTSSGLLACVDGWGYPSGLLPAICASFEGQDYGNLLSRLTEGCAGYKYNQESLSGIPAFLVPSGMALPLHPELDRSLLFPTRRRLSLMKRKTSSGSCSSSEIVGSSFLPFSCSWHKRFFEFSTNCNNPC